MTKFYFILSFLAFQLSSTAQETIDISLQFDADVYKSELSSNNIGKILALTSLVSKDEGHLVSLKNNSSNLVWQLTVQVTGAEAIVPYFDELIIENGSKIRAYSPTTYKSTPFFYQNNNTETKSFALPLIEGEIVIIEATFPTQEAYDNFKLSISEVGALYSVQGFGEAPSCFVNVNCSEGNPWQDQIRAVAKYMTVSGSDIGHCSGSLVNNTNQDCKNYFLSAQHCGMTSTNAEFGQFVFYFNYQSNSCTSPANDNGLDQETVVGCTKIASSGTSTTLPPDGSDFLLMELNAIPKTYNVYYAGWNRSDIAQIQGNGATIQHPRGDLKKISFWSTVTGSFTSQAHLEVIGIASANGDGLVEPKSSGSPIFDGNKNIIGNVTAGSSGCVSDYTAGSASIIGGRFKFHWDQNGTVSNLQLKPWLDPTNSGVMSLNGKQQCQTVGINEQHLNKTNISVFPNPTNQFITINSSKVVERVNLYSVDGKLILQTTDTQNIDVSNFSLGIIIVEVYLENGEIAHTKVYKQ